MLNLEDARRSGLMGAAENFNESLTNPAARFAGDLFLPQALPPPPGITRQQQREAGLADFRARDAAMPSFTTAPGLVDQALEGGAALAGQLAGSLMSPENLIGGLAGGARRVGQSAASYLGQLFARGAAVQAPVAGVANAGVQGLDMAAGDKADFSPAELALATALGGALGGGLNVSPELARMAIGRIREFRTARGATPEQAAAPVTPEEALATWSSEDVRALAEANGVTDPADPFVARIEQRLGLRRAAEADPLVAARQRVDAVNLPQGQAPQTPAQQVARLLPGVEDQVAGEAASGLRFQQPGAQGAEVDARLRSLVPGLEPRPEPPPVIALPGENGRVRGQIIEPNATDLPSPREVVVPVRGTGEPGVQAGAELRTGQGTALVPTEPGLPRGMSDAEVTAARARAAVEPPAGEAPGRLFADRAGGVFDSGEVASRRPAGLLTYDPAVGGAPMAEDAVARAAAQNRGGTLQPDARRARVIQEVNADIEAGIVPRAQRRQEIMARLAAQDPPDPIRVPGEGAPRGPDRPVPPQTYGQMNRAGIEARESGRPSGNDRPPPWTGDRPPEPPPTPRPPEGGSGGGGVEPPSAPPDLTPWRTAADKARTRAAELRAELDVLNAGREARRRGDKANAGPAGEANYKTPAALDRAIAAKESQATALDGRVRVLERAMQDMAEGRPPPVRLAYDTPADNAPAIPGKPAPPTSVVQRIRDLGGMRDDRGDFVKYEIPGLVNNKATRSFEDMADQLAYEGYFPELRAEMDGGGVRTINVKDALIRAIEETQAGRPQYTPEMLAEYEAKVAAREVALDDAAAVARAFDLSPGEVRGLSRGQLADLVREVRSLDDLDAIVRSQEAAHAADLADFEARMNDPDQFNSNLPPFDEERARSRPVTQEDIERVPPPDSEGPRPPGDGAAGGPRAEQPPRDTGAESRGQEAQGQLDRPASGPPGAAARGAGDAVGGDGQGAGRPAEGAGAGQRELIPNDRPATQAAAAREAQGAGRIRSEASQKGVEDFALFDPHARDQKNLDIEGAAKRTADAVNRETQGKLYGGFPLGDPDAWRFLFGPIGAKAKGAFKGWAESLAEMNDAFRTTRAANRAEDARTPRGSGEGTPVFARAGNAMPAALRATGAFIRAATYSDGIAMRAMADRLPEASRAALHEFLDSWHANAGRAGTGKGATYGEGVEQSFNRSVNKLNDILGKMAKDKASMEQVVRLVQNPSQIRPGSPLHDAADGIRTWLREQRSYMVENGVEVGDIKRGYFPRRLDVDSVWANQTGFLKDAERAYRASGMGAVEAKAAAEGWLDSIKHGGADPTNPLAHKGAPGLSPDHVSERVLAKAADEILAPYLLKDPLQTLVGYAHTAARRAELARVMGPENQAWTKLADAFRRDGAEDALGRVGDFVRTQTGHVTGSWNSPKLQKAAGWVRLWGTLGLLEKATLTSLTEVLNAGARSGRVVDSWNAVKTMAAYHMGRESGERLRLLAEDVGAMTNSLAGSMSAARWNGGRPASAAQAAIADRYFRAIGLEQWTHGMNVAATGVGERFIWRMANDLGAEGRAGRQASFALAELGIPREKHEAFAAWVKKSAGDGMTVDALRQAPKEVASAYRDALFRFATQVSMRPGAISRPRWANSPLGSMAFHLSAYAYAVHDNVILRAKRVFQNGDLTTGDKLVLAGKMLASLSLAIPAQMALGMARSEVFDSEKTKKASQENLVANAVSRSGILGAVDPWLQIIGGLKYRRELSTLMLGPTLGKAASGLQVAADQTQASINPYGPDRKRTDSEKRKLVTAAYDIGIEPTVNFAAARLGVPLPIAFAIAQGVGASKTRGAFVSAVGAPPPRDNRRRP